MPTLDLGREITLVVNLLASNALFQIVCRYPVAAGCDCGALLPSSSLHSIWVGTCAPWSPHCVPPLLSMLERLIALHILHMLAKSLKTCSIFCYVTGIVYLGEIMCCLPFPFEMYPFVLWALEFEPSYVLHFDVMCTLTLWLNLDDMVMASLATYSLSIPTF